MRVRATMTERHIKRDQSVGKHGWVSKPSTNLRTRAIPCAQKHIRAEIAHMLAQEPIIQEPTPVCDGWDRDCTDTDVRQYGHRGHLYCTTCASNAAWAEWYTDVRVCEKSCCAHKQDW